MTVKTFFYGLTATFALPWLIMIAVPSGTMSSIEAPQFDENADEKTGAYQPKTAGRMTIGSEVYGQQGCIQCHTQLTRPDYAGQDVFRDGHGGLRADDERGNTTRITNYMDFGGEEVAHFGESRIGPDLSNYGRRLDQLAFIKNTALADELGVGITELGDKAFNKEQYVYQRLLDPKKVVVNAKKTNCPKNYDFFKKEKSFGQGSVNAVQTDNGYQYIANDKARALASYLINLRKDDDVPSSMIYDKTKLNNKKAK